MDNLRRKDKEYWVDVNRLARGDGLGGLGAVL